MTTADRPTWVGTSWKMNKTLSESVAFIDELLAADLPAGVQPFVLPAHTALATVRNRLPAGCGVLLGAQNAHWETEGAGTGEVSMRMVADAGARLVEIGHSERRASFGETDETVARKAAGAVAYGLTPLICVGEPWAIRDAGAAESFVEAQLRTALRGLSGADVSDVLIAYEPVWAIGVSGRAATLEETGPVLATVSAVLAELSETGRARAILYGGSVDADNAADLLTDPHTDGLFVGRAAWTAAGFIELLYRSAPALVRHPNHIGAHPPTLSAGGSA